MTAATLVINRARSSLLADVDAGKVYRSMSGCILIKAVIGRNNMRADKRVTELVEHGLVRLGCELGEQVYGLTAAGQAALESYVPPGGPQ